MIKFAGVPLLQPDHDGYNELLPALRAYHMDDLNSLFVRHEPLDGTLRTVSVCHAPPRTPLPRPNYSAPPPLKLNQLYWPTGAARWSQFVGLCLWDDLLEILDKIKARVTATSTAPGTARALSPMQLVISDSDFSGDPKENSYEQNGNNGPIALSTEMYLLDPRPIVIVPDQPTLYLLPLVDARYWWQWINTPQRVRRDNIPTKTKEDWNGWLEILQYAIDDTKPPKKPKVELKFEPKTIPAAYVAPDRNELDRITEPVPAILDALAHSCGRRFVRRIDGECVLTNVEESQGLHGVNISIQTNVVGGLIATPTATQVNNADDPPAANVPNKTTDWKYTNIVPEFVDVVFRKTVEWANPQDLDLPTQGGVRPPGKWGTRPLETYVMYGAGTRTIRTSLPVKFQATTYVPRTSKTIYTPTWVGRVFFEEDTTKEPKGLVDKDFLGDRYFRLADQISQDWLGWQSQRHEYELAGVHKWYPTGFDDYVLWDAITGTTHVKSMPYDFGCDAQLVQLHRQCVYQPDVFVGFIVGPWTLHPKELEPITTLYPPDSMCSLQAASGPATEIWLDPCNIGVDADVFASTWEWMSAEAMPFVPCDPHAAKTSIEYGKALVGLGDPVTVTIRSHKLVQQLKNDLGCAIIRDVDGNPILDSSGNVMFDRTACLSTASGFVKATRYGCEWLVDFIDCN